MRQGILLIDDDPEIAALVAPLCKSELGMVLHAVETGDEGLKLALDGSFALVIIDVNLPGLHGFDVCSRLKRERPEQLVLMLTARNEEIDTVLGLELGADDYVVKPFRPRELAARMKALLRRPAPADRPDAAVLNVGDLEIEFARRRVRKAGEVIALTLVEYELLAFLAERAGFPVSREEIMEQVLGYSSKAYDTSITSHLCRLRLKIEDDPEKPRYLLTVRGHGYRLAAPAELSSKGKKS